MIGLPCCSHLLDKLKNNLSNSQKYLKRNAITAKYYLTEVNQKVYIGFQYTPAAIIVAVAMNRRSCVHEHIRKERDSDPVDAARVSADPVDTAVDAVERAGGSADPVDAD